MFSSAQSPQPRCGQWLHMKPIAARRKKTSALPVAWREAEYAALSARSADRFEDRVSEDVFNVEDERVEIALIVQRMPYGLN
jgi:hypothetical protein